MITSRRLLCVFLLFFGLCVVATNAIATAPMSSTSPDPFIVPTIVREDMMEEGKSQLESFSNSLVTIPKPTPELPGSLCQGQPTDARFDKSGWLSLPAVRTVHWDYQASQLWIGGKQGNVLVYDSQSGNVEWCLALGEGITINAIYDWQPPNGDDSIWVATDGAGVWQYNKVRKTWHQYTAENHELLDNRSYCINSGTSENGHPWLVICTFSGISIFDGKNWSMVFTLPPDGAKFFDDFQQVSATEWWLACTSCGTYRLIDGEWERFSSQGMQRWDKNRKEWYTPFNYPVTFPDNVRDLELTFDGRIAIAGDEGNEQGLVFQSLGDPRAPTTYEATIPQPDRSYDFHHLTSVQMGLPKMFIVTNWKEGEGGGAYLILPRMTPIQLVKVASYDAVILTNGDMYVATGLGVKLIKMSLPS